MIVMTTIETTVERLRFENEALRKRYQWAANELLACDYGDNDHPDKVVGWCVYGWRFPRNGERRIYGPSIDAAIDAELVKATS